MGELLRVATEKSFVKPPVVLSEKTASRESRVEAPPTHLTHLQSALGNQAMQRVIQAKLAISQPGDAYEREADRLAEQVMRGSDARVSSALTAPALQAQAIAGKTPSAAKGVIPGSGQSLPKATRAFFESRLGSDFSAVRIHTDAQGADSAQTLNARAYTVGQDIVFGAGQYAPHTSAGQRLLAHELTHVVQQNTRNSIAVPFLQRQAGGAAVSHRFTAERVNVVVRSSCAPAVFGFANVEAATRTALNAIFHTDCIEESRRTRIQRNLTAHGLDIRCRRSANLQTPGACAESTGFFIPANIFTIGSRSFAGHPDSVAGCQPLESTILHEIVHLTRGFAQEALPSSCEASCFGVGGGNPDLCQNIDVFGRRRAP